MKGFLVFVPIALAGAQAIAATPIERPDGMWLNPRGSVAVRTGACGERLCGWVIWADADARSDAKDGGVAELVGTRLLEDYRTNGPHVWSGTVFVPDMNRRFASQIEQTAPDRLKIKGCILGGLFCRSQIWTRIERIPGDAHAR